MSETSNNHARNVELAEISAIMRTEGGRNVIRRILQLAGVFSPTYVKDNPEETIRRSVRRDFGLQIEAQIKEAAPGEYFTLLKEMEDAS